MKSGTGPLAAAMADLNATRGDFGADRLRTDYLHPLERAARGLIVHGNFLTRDDVDWLADPRRGHLSVIYCPRTHAHFGHPPHPWRTLLEAGVRVALGTDGRGSNPDLSVWNELRFLHDRFPEVPPETLVRLATAEGAAALGVEAGAVVPGRPADLCAIGLPQETGDAWTDLLAPGSAPRGDVAARGCGSRVRDCLAREQCDPAHRPPGVHVHDRANDGPVADERVDPQRPAIPDRPDPLRGGGPGPAGPPRPPAPGRSAVRPPRTRRSPC